MDGRRGADQGVNTNSKSPCQGDEGLTVCKLNWCKKLAPLKLYSLSLSLFFSLSLLNVIKLGKSASRLLTKPGFNCGKGEIVVKSKIAGNLKNVTSGVRGGTRAAVDRLEGHGTFC